MQRMVAAACLVAGVFVLAGFGWALLGAGAVLWFRDDRAAAWMAEKWHRVQGVAVTLARMPRRALAGVSMGTGMVAAPTGVSLALGLGFGLVAAGVMLVGFSLLTGEGA